jgi:hypothetical protein
LEFKASTSGPLTEGAVSKIGFDTIAIRNWAKDQILQKSSLEKQEEPPGHFMSRARSVPRRRLQLGLESGWDWERRPRRSGTKVDLLSLECGGLTPLSFLSFPSFRAATDVSLRAGTHPLPHTFRKERKKARTKESGVKPPHSKGVVSIGVWCRS